MFYIVEGVIIQITAPRIWVYCKSGSKFKVGLWSTVSYFVEVIIIHNFIELFKYIWFQCQWKLNKSIEFGPPIFQRHVNKTWSTNDHNNILKNVKAWDDNRPMLIQGESAIFIQTCIEFSFPICPWKVKRTGTVNWKWRRKWIDTQADISWDNACFGFSGMWGVNICLIFI